MTVFNKMLMLVLSALLGILVLAGLPSIRWIRYLMRPTMAHSTQFLP